MKNDYIAVLILIVLIVGGVLIFGVGYKAKTPMPDMQPPEDTDQVACTMEAKLCPDGSYVGRSGPKCEFEACPGAADTAVTTPAVKEFTITAKNFAFTPASITVKQGDKVKITFNNINGFHDFKIDEYGIATLQKQSPNSEVLEFTADKAGSFEYYCSVGTHRAMGMKGTLKVE